MDRTLPANWRLPWLRWLQWGSVVGLVAFWSWAMLTHPAPGGKPFGVDASAYWSASFTDPYNGPDAGLPGAYLYSPAFLQALAPLRLLPWELFIGLWLALQLGALAWLVTPLGALVLLAVPPVTSEVLIGNLHIFFAVALVWSFRCPGAWALALLTKPTLGVGMAWYLARREWRAFAVGLGTTLLIVLVSLVIAPDLWVGWIEGMRGAENRGGMAWTIFLAVRLLLALGLTWYAGRRNRPAYLPLALYVALPIPWLEGLTLLAAIPRLLRLPVGEVGALLAVRAAGDTQG